jgi:hypothetical protein
MSCTRYVVNEEHAAGLVITKELFPAVFGRMQDFMLVERVLIFWYRFVSIR